MGFKSFVNRLVGFEETQSYVSEEVSLGIDRDEYNFRQIGGSYIGMGRSISPADLKKSVELARYVFDKDPLAHGIIQTMTDFVAGEGFSVLVEPMKEGEELDDEERRKVRLKAQGVIDRHWNDRVNNWSGLQFSRVRELAIDGEAFYTVKVNEANGAVRLGHIDALTVRQIYYHPDNMTEPIAIEVAKNNSIDGDFYRVVHEDETVDSPTIGLLIGAEEGESFVKTYGNHKEKAIKFKGSCVLATVNRHTSHSRGRSDLLSILDWLNAYGRMMYTFFDRIELMLSFIWDVTLEGADEARLNEWRKNHPKPPKPGAVRAHGTGEKWEAVAPNLRFEDNKIGTGMMKSQILSATGQPPHWYAESADGTQGAVVEMGTPALKRLVARQLEVMSFFKFIFEFVIDQAIIHKELDGKYQYRIAIEAPEMSSRDLTRAGASFLSVLSAIEGAIANGVIDDVVGQQIAVQMSQSIGVKIDIEAMRERIKKNPPPKPDVAIDANGVAVTTNGRTPNGPKPPQRQLGDPQGGKGE